MEHPGEHDSVRDSDWHPRQPDRDSVSPKPTQREAELGLMAKTELKLKIEANFPPERIRELRRQEGLMKRGEPTLDPLTKAELETRITALYPSERMKKLFEQEGVSKNNSVNRSLKRKFLDFLKI